MRANVFGQIPLLNSACLVARYQFPLVRVNTNIVDCVNGQPESRSWHRVKDVRATWRLVVIIAMKVRIPAKVFIVRLGGAYNGKGPPEIPYLYGPVFTPRH